MFGSSLRRREKQSICNMPERNFINLCTICENRPADMSAIYRSVREDEQASKKMLQTECYFCGRTKFLKTPHEIPFLDSLPHCASLELSNIYAPGMVIAFLPFKQKEEHTMRKSISIISMRLLAGSLMIPSGRAYADN